MSTPVSDSAVVLRRVDYSDTDRVLTLLTRDHGKVGVLARGVRKAGARLAPHVDLFARSRVQLARGRGSLLVLTQAQSEGAVPALGEPLRAACAAVVAELADRVLEDGAAPEPGVFDLVVEALAGCGEPGRDPRAAMLWFARRMVDRLGYAPELVVCAADGAPLAEADHGFSAAVGGLLCPACEQRDPLVVVCSPAVIKVLRVAAAGDADLWRRLRLDPALLDTVETVVERELEHHLDRRLRSLDVLRAMRRSTAGRLAAP